MLEFLALGAILFVCLASPGGSEREPARPVPEGWGESVLRRVYPAVSALRRAGCYCYLESEPHNRNPLLALCAACRDRAPMWCSECECSRVHAGGCSQTGPVVQRSWPRGPYGGDK